MLKTHLLLLLFIILLLLSMLKSKCAALYLFLTENMFSGLSDEEKVQHLFGIEIFFWGK